MRPLVTQRFNQQNRIELKCLTALKENLHIFLATVESENCVRLQ